VVTDPRDGSAAPFNLARACLQAHAADPARASASAFSFIDGERVETWTYAQAWGEVQRVARALLARGLEPRDRVLLRLPHSPAYAFAFFGANAAGLVPIPASPQLTDEEAAFLLEDSGARAVIGSRGTPRGKSTGPLLPYEELATSRDTGQLPATYAEDPAYLQYTSGTTAKPKGVLHAQRVVRGRELMRGDAWMGLRQNDVTMHAGTLNWSYTLGAGLMDPWCAGAHALLVASGTDAATWPALISQHRVTVFIAVPTVYRQLLKYGRPEDHDLSALRHALCAGEALSSGVAREWSARVGVPLYESLGMTEISTYISSGPAVPVREGSPGRAQPGRRVAVLGEEGGDAPLAAGEVGLLAIERSDPGLMLGYWRRPAEEAAAFRGQWFIGGDRAAIDEDGYVWFHGRADDLIKSFGYRLSPLEIEVALASHPAVAEAAVVGRPIDADKTLVSACVVPEPGATVEEHALRAYAAERLAAYKQPHEYHFVESLPRTANGKLQRGVLLQRLQDGMV
jgi:acyl-coenzyme A synthetase/AMP-(fatty) acid ligase